MYLYELPRDDEIGTKIYCNLSDGSSYLMFHHTDGAYSYCKSEKGGIVHLSAMAPIVPFEDGYRIKEEKSEDKN